jgi:4-alpha-glucanotransferase
MLFPRSSGILLHPTSFPSRFGMGDMGIEAYRFIDFLVESDQQYWQVLPLGPRLCRLRAGDRPESAFAQKSLRKLQS